MFQKNFKEARAEGKSNFSGIQQFEIKSKFPSGRIHELEVLTNKGIFTVKGDKIRWLFKEGSKILPSAKFTIEKNGKVWVIDGSGFGHGIGMCQMGARARAKAGQNFKEILEAYYPGAKLQCVSSGK
jgi:stage II sporulation protein D